MINSLNGGGAERAALNLASECQHLSCVVVSETRAGDLLSDPAARSVAFASDSPKIGGRGRRIVSLARTLRALKPNLVVSMMSPIVTLTAARLVGAPVIHWLGAPWSNTTSVARPTCKGRVQRSVLRTALDCSATVAVTSPGLCEECVALGMPTEKLALLPSGLHLTSSSETKQTATSDRPTIVTVGRLERPKRHDITLRAVGRLAKEMPVRLIVVGSGADEASLRTLAAEVGLAGDVEFTGFVRSPDEYLRQADVFTLASDYEGFGNVIVEALAMGLPIVVSDVPYGPRFILENGRFGTLVPPDSPEALERALRSALAQGPLDEQKRAQVRARAESFSVRRVAARFTELVELALTDSSGIPHQLRQWR